MLARPPPHVASSINLRDPYPEGGESDRPCSIRTVFSLPAIRFTELLRSEVRHHRRYIEITTGASRLHHRCYGQGSCIVWIIGCGFVHLPERSVRIGMFLDECERAIDCFGLRSVCRLGHVQKRIEYKWSQRLTGAQQTICGAVKATIFGLLRPQITRGPLKRAAIIEARTCSRRSSGKEECAPANSHDHCSDSGSRRS